MRNIIYIVSVSVLIIISGCVAYDPIANSDKEPIHCQYDEEVLSSDQLDSDCKPDDQTQTNDQPSCYIDDSCPSGVKSCSSFSCVIDPEQACGAVAARNASYCNTNISGMITCYVKPTCSSAVSGCATDSCMNSLTTCNNYIGMSNAVCYDDY